MKIAGVSEHLGTATRGACKDFPGLQVADGLAYGVWNIEPKVDEGIVGLTPNAPGTTIAEARANTAHMQSIPYFRTHLDATMLAAYKTEIVTFHEFRREHGRRKREKAINSDTSEKT